MWGLTTIAGTLLVFNLLTLAIGGAAALGKTAIESGAGAVSSTAGEAPGLAKALGIDFDDLLAPVNRRLRAENKPAVDRSQLEAATKDVVGDALRQGRLDRDMLTTSIAQNTKLSRTDAEDIATRMQAAFDRTVERARVTVKGTASSSADRCAARRRGDGQGVLGRVRCAVDRSDFCSARRARRHAAARHRHPAWTRPRCSGGLPHWGARRLHPAHEPMSVLRNRMYERPWLAIGSMSGACVPSSHSRSRARCAFRGCLSRHVARRRSCPVHSPRPRSLTSSRPRSRPPTSPPKTFAST